MPALNSSSTAGKSKKPALRRGLLRGLRRGFRRGFTLGGALLLWVITVVVACGFGAVPLTPLQIATMLAKMVGLPVDASAWPPTYELIFLQIRLPRVILGSLVGAALALSGAAFQGLLRNPLAGPYVLGISGGASLGAVLAMALGLGSLATGLSTVPVMAFLGALGTLILIMALGSSQGRLPTTTLILAGVAVGSFFSSVVSIIVLFSDERMGSILFWLMGGLSGAGWSTVVNMTLYMLPAALVLFWHARNLNAMAFGDEAAGHLGVEVEKVKKWLLVAASLLAAAAVSSSGVISFVGLIVPHVVRMIKGPDHRGLLPLSMVLGAVFLVACDTVARTVMAPQELPVGAVTALCGAPFFVHLLRRHKTRPF
ncbi:MAG TPA: iron ABC transporter permease [Firmicutes bacterium]|nr:iron ABC transporter permease [Bacillota bacterium]